MADPDFREGFSKAARLIAAADGLLITAGAGIGVDSGLPDFRGTEGFWQEYPAFGQAKTRFEEIANPAAFRANPKRVWGFYGHRLQLYRETIPHAGFALLQQMGERLPQGAFVFTSNVDGQFQRAGFDETRIVECHGSIHHLQCLDQCNAEIWAADSLQPTVDAPTCTLTSPLPTCPSCGHLARPNVLMFGDWEWHAQRTDQQYRRMLQWRKKAKRIVVLEIGAGTSVATVRTFSEAQDVPLIRINPTEPQVSGFGIELPVGALSGVTAIAEALRHERQ